MLLSSTEHSLPCRLDLLINPDWIREDSKLETKHLVVRSLYLGQGLLARTRMYTPRWSPVVMLELEDQPNLLCLAWLLLRMVSFFHRVPPDELSNAIAYESELVHSNTHVSRAYRPLPLDG